MKKLLVAALLTGAIACNNPEDSATGATADSTQSGDNNTLNTPPGGTSADTSGGMMMDTSHTDTTHR